MRHGVDELPEELVTGLRRVLQGQRLGGGFGRMCGGLERVLRGLATPDTRAIRDGLDHSREGLAEHLLEMQAFREEDCA